MDKEYKYGTERFSYIAPGIVWREMKSRSRIMTDSNPENPKETETGEITYIFD